MQAWVNYTTPQTASVVSSLVPDADGAMTVVFDRIVSTNLASISLVFRDEFEAAAKSGGADGRGGVTVKDFRLALHETQAQEKLVLTYSDFVRVVYDLLWDPDEDKKLARVKKSR